MLDSAQTPYALDMMNLLSLHEITCDISICSESKHVSTAVLA